MMGKITDISAQSPKDFLNYNPKKKTRERKLLSPASQKIIEYFKVDKNIIQDQIHPGAFERFGILEVFSNYPPDEDSSSSIDCSIKLSLKKSPISCSDSETNKSPTEDESPNNTDNHVRSSSESQSSVILDKSSLNICSNKKNYKSLTRERRVEANARERSRVHTISAAFETLRHAVPGYSNSPKLSKLGILRIACCYIESLNQLLQTSDKIDPQFNSNFSKCIQKLAQTIASESKLKNNTSTQN